MLKLNCKNQATMTSTLRNMDPFQGPLLGGAAFGRVVADIPEGAEVIMSSRARVMARTKTGEIVTIRFA